MATSWRLSIGTAAARLDPTAKAKIREQRIVKGMTGFDSVVGRERNEGVNEEGSNLDIRKLRK